MPFSGGRSSGKTAGPLERMALAIPDNQEHSHYTLRGPE
ncbi:hypothetical protein FRUB_01048 [Fimbriiglobus ruber]|uniref:Uncharacterized protein n=1 Tax=Fimbriiglobus ruber TaxID=1908690 RepID=A0A225EDF6_9BACT|nr:hypothetical protein FRUB_01048 [Fimbriiglobus ruber]